MVREASVSRGFVEPSRRARARARSSGFVSLLALSGAVAATACHGPEERPVLPRSQTWAELRTVRRSVVVTPPNESERAPYPRERLVDGEVIKVGPEGLAWLRRDGGATLLVSGPAELTLRADAIELKEGKVFVDTPSGETAELATPAGKLHLSRVRASLSVHGSKTEAYVLAGEIRTDGSVHAGPGERLLVDEKSASAVPALAWEDWTGGLATTERSAEPSPYGVGTVGARRAGEQGAPRFPLAIQKLDVKVTIDKDLAITEVDELFFNPSSEVVEGVYRFRTPDGATLHRFGVDKDGVVVWGRVKEKAAAAAQYQANVYQGSTEDPALLEWDAPGVYRARLYPIAPGESRRVVVRYAEWLGRTGPKGERRLYVYPMAAEGTEASLPHIEELTARIDLAKAGARDVRVGMAGVREGTDLVVREHDVVPRADLAVELFDEGLATPRGFIAPHVVDVETLPPADRAEATRRAATEAEYVLVPLRAADVPLAKGGIDLAIVVDTSAATEPSSLAIARAATHALLAHLGKDDRAVVWTGDANLRPVVAGKDKLAPVDEAARRAILTGLATADRGGATDLGAMLSQAAASLDPARRGAVVYIGDGAPTVGEIGLADLRDRLAKLPRPVRVFGLGVGDGADMGILKGLARGASAERIGDANAAARAALRLLEQAERPAWLGAAVDLGPQVERVFPRDLSAMVADETLLVVGRIAAGATPPSQIAVTGPSGKATLPLSVSRLQDSGDLRHRWADGRLAQMLDENTGRAAMVDLGVRHGIITPVTSLYVPTKNEMTPDERAELERKVATYREQNEQRLYKRRENNPQGVDEDRFVAAADNKEGGTGTRAKGEEGSMGSPSRGASNRRFGVAGPTTVDAPAAQAMASSAPASPAPEAAAATATAAPGGRDPNAPPMVPTPAAAAEAPVARAKGGKAMTGAPAPEPAPPPPPPPAAKPAPVVNGQPAKDAETTMARAEAKQERDGEGVRTPLSDAAEFGMIGMLQQDQQPADATAVAGNMWGGDIGGAFGAGGLSGIGEGGGGRGDGIGLGAIGTIGHGSGAGQGFGTGTGRLSGKHAAFESRLQSTDKSAIDGKNSEKGKKKRAKVTDGDLPRVVVDVKVTDVPHAAVRCGGAAYLAFDERVQLWRERLSRFAGNAEGVASVYRRALALCEAPTWRERSKLYALMLDAMPSVPQKVQLWRVMFKDLGAADALYRGILARVRTPNDMRQLHDALGLRSIDPGLLAKTLEQAKTPENKIKKLRELVKSWPDDFALALKLLDTLEDADDKGGGRELARKLRARPDADARLRTAVGEFYLRAAAHEPPEEAAQDRAEAKRAFGEIVEFAPDDPIARRRLGDLLRAHGWYEEAQRQYQTLARLSPDDPSVALLLAASAEGLGKLEEAVKWTEKGGAAGAPDVAQGPAVTARAFASTYLAWGLLAAREGKKTEEARNIETRLLRVLATERTQKAELRGPRVSLTWSHPELHPTLWSNALGSPMPAPEGDVTLGVSQVVLPAREGTFVEVRVEKEDLEHAARLGAQAWLTLLVEEGDKPKIVRIPIKFEADGKPSRRFSVAGGELAEVGQ